MLAGISPEWYTWLEQGRNINVSVQLLESLVRALRLDVNERTQLFLLVLRQPPPVHAFVETTVSPTIQSFLDQLGSIPAGVVDARMNVLAWNKAFCAVFGDYEAMSERERNVIWRIFTSPSSTDKQWEEHAQLYLAQFRAGYNRFIDDPWWVQQITALSSFSPKFREFWARHDVLNISEGQKIMHHPLVGELNFDFLFFQSIDSSNLRFLIHTPHSTTNTAIKVEHLLTSK
jgi:hypothetical protein